MTKRRYGVIISHVMSWEASYVRLHKDGELARRAEVALAGLSSCEVCPHRCGADRQAGEQGVCRSGAVVRVASWNAHHGEEPPISGYRGSGTIFFSGCSGGCIFCQNYTISQMNHGQDVSHRQLADMMLSLQARGCHNINLVTPTHFVPQILAALDMAAAGGLRLPIVYNTSGYDLVSTLELLDGVVDIYMPDAKYADDRVARRLSGFKEYVKYNRLALKEMLRQVGDELVMGERRVARRGMLIRHLVLPNRLAGTKETLEWIAAELSPRVWVNLMEQYFPAHKAVGHEEVGRRLTAEEYMEAIDCFHDAGLENGWMQNISFW